MHGQWLNKLLHMHARYKKMHCVECLFLLVPQVLEMGEGKEEVPAWDSNHRPARAEGLLPAWALTMSSVTYRQAQYKSLHRALKQIFLIPESSLSA